MFMCLLYIYMYSANFDGKGLFYRSDFYIEVADYKHLRSFPYYNLVLSSNVWVDQKKNREYMIVKPQCAGCTTSYSPVIIGYIM